MINARQNSRETNVLGNLGDQDVSGKKRLRLDTTVEKESSKNRNFYRRNLPSSCIAFCSSEGRLLLKESLAAGTAETFFPLSEQFRTQDDPSFCGLSTLVMSLNALSIDPERVWKGIWRWFHEDMLECCTSLDQVRERGITMEELACLARCNGAKTPLLGGRDHGILRADEFTVETLRSIIREVCRHGAWCKRINCGKNEEVNGKKCTGPCEAANFCNMDTEQTGVLIASYSRQILGQTGGGHFSPIAAFHEPSDSCLIMDVARFKYPPHWVSIQILFEAMQPVDKSTGKPRGIILLAQGGGIWNQEGCLNVQPKEGDEAERKETCQKCV